MTTSYTHFSDLAKEVQPPDKGVLSRTLHNDDRLKSVLSGLAQGDICTEGHCGASATHAKAWA